MHELAAAENILEIVKEAVCPEQHPGIRSVRVRVGAASGVAPDSLTFAFEGLIRETPLRAASLRVVDVPWRLKCNVCRSIAKGDVGELHCSLCGSSDVRVVSGTEFEVVDVEIADLEEG